MKVSKRDLKISAYSQKIKPILWDSKFPLFLYMLLHARDCAFHIHLKSSMQCVKEPLILLFYFKNPPTPLINTAYLPDTILDRFVRFSRMLLVMM